MCALSRDLLEVADSVFVPTTKRFHHQRLEIYSLRATRLKLSGILLALHESMAAAGVWAARWRRASWVGETTLTSKAILRHCEPDDREIASIKFCKKKNKNRTKVQTRYRWIITGRSKQVFLNWNMRVYLWGARRILLLDQAHYLNGYWIQNDGLSTED